MASLKHKRAPIRAAFTRTLNELKAEILKGDCDMVTINRLKKYLDDRFVSLEKVDEEISDYLQGKETTEEEFGEEYYSVIEYRDKFSDISFSIDNLCNKAVHEQSQHEIFDERSGNTVITRSKYKLPKLELQKFSGNPIEWLGWWSQFKGIDEDVTLSVEYKFQYLIQAMIPKSIAYDLVVSFPPTATNYPKAIHQLKSRFGNEKLLIEVYIRELLKLVLDNSIKQNKSITPIYDKLETQLRALESLGVTKEKYAAMLYPLVESALPAEVLQVWILDSGARRHICHKKKHFHQLDESYRGQVKVANGKYVPIMGIGTVKMKLMTRKNKVRTVTVNKVLYAPQLIGNVLSVSTLTSLNYKVEFDRLIRKMKFKESEVGVADVTSDGIYVMRQPDQTKTKFVKGTRLRQFQEE